MSKKTEIKQSEKSTSTEKEKSSPKKTKREKFIKSAEARVSKLLNQMTLLGNLKDKKKFEFTDSDLKKIETAIGESFELLKKRFKNGEAKGEGFKL